MTDEQILTLASKYLELHPVHGDESVWDEWCGKQEDLLKFAQVIYQEGFDEGRYEQVLENMNYPEDYFTG